MNKNYKREMEIIFNNDYTYIFYFYYQLNP